VMEPTLEEIFIEKVRETSPAKDGNAISREELAGVMADA